MYAQILKYLKSKYLLFFSVHRFFRYAGIGVNASSIEPRFYGRR